MKNDLDRRSFLKAGAVAAAYAGVARAAEAPAVITRRSALPMVIASGNGQLFKNGGEKTCVETAFALLAQGVDPLNAVIAGVNVNELDPEDVSVGYGGIPNADGVVQLDACCMHGPTRRAGGVACLEGVRTPSAVAKGVLEHTDHHLLVGKDAQVFARQLGFTIEDDLNTPKSRALWLEWKQKIDPEHFITPEKRIPAGERAAREMIAQGRIDPLHYFGTINCNAVTAAGDIAGVTTTSGLAFKIPGRVGDSPILGAGLYVDNAVGAAGSTGRGEANLYNLSSFFIVEAMRRGAAPKDAAVEALQRIAANTVVKRLLMEDGRPKFNVSFYAVNKRGEFAGVALWALPKHTFAVCTEKGVEVFKMEGLAEAPPGLFP